MKEIVEKGKSRVSRLIDRALSLYEYITEGVWSDPRSNWRIDTIRTVNLSVRSFMDRDLQMRSRSLTYQTILAIVPALALFFAIGRGFGLQDVITRELIKALPSQKDLLENAFHYVDNYLAESSGGVFVGVGILFLLWTLISLLSNVEDSFNSIWGVKQGRSIFRKMTDYTAIFLILPVLMVCASGLQLVVTTALKTLLPFEFLTPAISLLLDFASVVMTWLLFAGAYLLIPNAKVKFPNALLAGVFAGTFFAILQWLFVSGQMYVAKYNAIYGSVAFLPLFLIWAQLAWVICLAGAVICYSSQNIFLFSFNSQIQHISSDYRRQIAVGVMSVIARRFKNGEQPLTPSDFSKDYDMPSRLISIITERMIDAGLLSKVVIDEKKEIYGLVPTLPPDQITLGYVLKAVDQYGNSDFIPNFAQRFAAMRGAYVALTDEMLANADKIKLCDFNIEEIK